MGQDIIGETLGYSSVISGSIETLSKARLVRVAGPSGTGKTTIAATLKAKLLRTGYEAVVLTAIRKDPSPFGVFERLAQYGKHVHVLKKTFAEDGAAFLRDIPLIGNSLALLAQAAIDVAASVQAPVSAEELEVLLSMQRLTGNKRLVLIVDDCQYLQEPAAACLTRLFSKEVQAALPGLEQVSVVLMENDEAEDETGEWREWLGRRAITGKRTRRPGRDEFPAILEAFGLSDCLAAGMYDALYAITGGHLKLAQQVASLYEGGGRLEGTSACNPAKIANTILKARLKALGSNASPVQRLLGIMACAGRSLSREEVECAFGDRAMFEQVFEIAIREEYLKFSEEIEVSHGIIEAAVLQDGESPDYHRKLEDCIRLIRPGDYLRRFGHSLRSGDAPRAANLAALILLRLAQGKMVPPSEAKLAELRAAAARYSDVVSNGRLAIGAMDASDHQGAITLLLNCPIGSDSLLGAELSHLLALNYFKLHSAYGYESAQRILSSWEGFTVELELWSRLMATQAAVYVHLGQFERGQKLWGKVKYANRNLKERSENAAAKVMTLHRQASMYFPDEIALRYVQEAVAFFLPSAGCQVPSNLFELTSSLTNLSALQFCVGDFEQAARFGHAALDYLTKLPGIRGVEPYKPINNATIAMYRAGHISAQDGADLLRRLILRDGNTYDRVLVASNMATLDLLAGRLSEGLETLRELFEYVKSGDMDPYYYTYCSSNLASAWFHAGQQALAEQVWHTIPSYIARFRTSERVMLEKRHQIMTAAFSRLKPGDIAGWDEYPSSCRSTFASATWGCFGRGFLLSDIQVWSET